MKSEKGVTLISLTIYIIAMTIVIGVISLVSTFFYKNTKSYSNQIDPMTEYTKFTNFFTEEVNHKGIQILECKDNYVVFDDGVQYTYIPENRGIYRNKVKICSEVEKCTFAYKIKNGKDVIGVTIQMKNAEEKTIDYTLKN